MDISVVLGISKTHLLARKKQSITAALGVTFGIGTYIIMMSFMTGLNGMLDSLVTNRTPHVHIYKELVPTENQPVEEVYPHHMNAISNIKPKQTPKRIYNSLGIISMFQNDKRVKGVTAQVNAQAFFISGTIELNGVINGIDPIKEAELFSINDYIIEGTAQDLNNTLNGIVLGAGLAKKMSINKGDRVQVVGTNGATTNLKVVAFYQSGLAEVDNVQCYANIETAQKILGESSDYITDINLKLYDIEKAPAIAAEIERQFDVAAVDIQAANAQYETGTQIRNIISYAVSITLLIVAGFGIYNILNMLIYEKMNDIAILKATGFSGADVRNIFISQAIIIGVVGGLIGLSLGYLGSFAISKAPFETEALPTIHTYPVNFDPTFYAIGITFALVTTFLAGYLPARKASKIDPVEIIRGQ